MTDLFDFAESQKKTRNPKKTLPITSEPPVRETLELSTHKTLEPSAVESSMSSIELTPSTPKALTVTELTQLIRGQLEPTFRDVWIQGEVSNYRPASSGHLYFSLKDSQSTISAAIFHWGSRKRTFEIKEGLEILAHGKLSVYAPRGSYQLLLDRIEPLGLGALQLAFEQLKLKLQNEGLFDAKRKREIPKYPRHIAIITSPTGAAIKDILQVLGRRAPQIRITVIPALVQGDSAPAQIVEGIRRAQSFHHTSPDLILVTRGGGSYEDLFCFNDESIVREIAASKLPVISAVGHEIDFTLSDFVSDLRAPTPSAAAEILSSHWAESIQTAKTLRDRLSGAMLRYLHLRKQQAEWIFKQLINPKDKLTEQIQRVDEFSLRLERAIKVRLDRAKAEWTRCAGQLNALSPLRVLERGYVLVVANPKDGNHGDSGESKEKNQISGQIYRSAKHAQKGEAALLRWHDGNRRVVFTDSPPTDLVTRNSNSANPTSNQ